MEAYSIDSILIFTWVFLAAVALYSTLESWLRWRHRRCVRIHRATVPARFAEQVSLEAHQKAADYTMARLDVRRWRQMWVIMVLLLWTLGGGLNTLDAWVYGFGWSALPTGVVVIIAFLLISTLIDLPWDIWTTFRLEAKFGFNKTTPSIYLMDHLKQLLLLMIIGVPLLWIMLWLMQASGVLWWLYAWAVWTGFSLLMMWIYPTFIAPIFNKFTPLEAGELKTEIEALLTRCGFASKGLFVMDGSRRSSHGNAYFTGFGKSKRIVFFDTLIKNLSIAETLAVLAHELGHFKLNHIKKRMVMMWISTLAAFAVMGWLADKTWFYHALGVFQTSNHALLLLFTLVTPYFLFWVSPIGNWFSRKHEFEADNYAAKHAQATDLIHALVNMYRDNASALIADPLYSLWYDSHPSAVVRVANLERHT